MCIIQDEKHKTNLATKCAVQTNQQVQGCQHLSSRTMLMLSSLSLYSLVIKCNFNSFLNIFSEVCSFSSVGSSFHKPTMASFVCTAETQTEN